jgi:hypothetical protein
MRRNKMIIGAVGATALTIGLGVGATLSANSDSTPPTPTTTMMDATDTTVMDGTHMNDDAGMSSMMDGTDMTMMDGTHMNDGAAMSSMMDGAAMTSMMGTSAMAAMHTMMHEALEGSVPADVLAACDEAHVSMSNAPASSSTDVTSSTAVVPDHAAHHADAQP